MKKPPCFNLNLALFNKTKSRLFLSVINLKVMINLIMVSITLLLLTMLLTGCQDSPIQIVKNGTLERNKTTTVGNALDHWGECDNPTWTTFQTANNVQVVEFNCKIRFAHYFDLLCELGDEGFERYSWVRKINSTKRFNRGAHCQGLDVHEMTQVAQFTLNTDNTFQLGYLGTIIMWKDGKTYTEEGTWEMLDKIYANDEKTYYRNIDLENNLAYAWNEGQRFVGYYQKAR